MPTASAPLRLLVVGDSLGIDFGQPLVNDLAATDVVSAVLDGHIDTGLARPDYFDWQSELQADLARYQPQVVVVFIGANDPQNFIDGGTALTYGTPAWNAAYAKRVGTFMAEATARRCPRAVDRDAAHGRPRAQRQDAGPSTASTRARPRCTGASPTSRRGPCCRTPRATTPPFLPDASGSEVQIREPDGTHIAPLGRPAPVPGRHRLHGPRMGTRPVGAKSVWVLRHAKAAAHGQDDHSRPLTARGTRQATDVGRYLAERRSRGSPSPSWCCPPRRARAVQTAELVVAQLATPVELVVERRPVHGRRR